MSVLYRATQGGTSCPVKLCPAKDSDLADLRKHIEDCHSNWSFCDTEGCISPVYSGTKDTHARKIHQTFVSVSIDGAL